MPWLLASPSHQQPWYWTCRINRALPSIRKDFNYMRHLSVDLRNHRKCRYVVSLTHWGRVMHICIGKLTIIGSDNGLLPGRPQAIIWTNAGILLIGPLETNFSEILIEIHTFTFKKMHLKMASVKWHPFCLGLNVLKGWVHIFLNIEVGINHSAIYCRLPLSILLYWLTPKVLE